MIQPALLQPRRLRVAALALAKLVCFGICVCTNVVAVAEDATDPKREAEYQELINYALEEYERGSWEESAALFHRAHELTPSARTLRGLGLATYEARRYAESVRHLRSALTDKRRPLTDKQREEVEHTLERAKLFVGLLDIDLHPKDAQLTINGRVVEPEPEGTFMVDSGYVDMEANAPGYLTASKRMRIAGGEQQRIVLRLASATPPETHVERPAPALLSEASPAFSAAPARTESSEGSALTAWKWVSGAGAVLALGTGGTLLAMQKAQAPAYERECNQAQIAAPDCDDRHTYLSKTLWTGSIIGFGLGGALAALSVTLFVLDSKNASQNDTSLVCGGGPLGVACHGQF